MYLLAQSYIYHHIAISTTTKLHTMESEKRKRKKKTWIWNKRQSDIVADKISFFLSQES